MKAAGLAAPLACFTWLVVLLVVAPPAGRPAEAHPKPPAFIVGVFSQPATSFAAWKARGINTLLRYENEGGRTAMGDWCGLAVDQGLFMIRQPFYDDLKGDTAEPYLLAWMHEDEPEQHPENPPEKLAGDYATLKAACRKAGKDVPVFCNFSGDHISFKKTPKSKYDAYLKSCDWVGMDFYPVSGWNRPDWLGRPGEILDVLKDWSGNKPCLSFIETSAMRLSWTPKETRGVTPDELRAEIWDSIIHGAVGIVYFPQQIGEGFKYDATPPEVEAEMKKQNQLLADLGEVFNKGKINPPAMAVTVPPPLEAAWRVKDGKKYLFVLNLSNEGQKNSAIQVKGLGNGFAEVVGEKRKMNYVQGKIVDVFMPLELHIYLIP